MRCSMCNMNILITGGAGYIGSHMAWALVDAGFSPVILDDLSTGNKSLLPEDISFYEGDIANERLLHRIVEKHSIDTVFHFAGSIRVEESVRHPEKYFHNNTEKSEVLIKTIAGLGICNFIFSSTAAVYGEISSSRPVSERSPKKPVSPYGESKLKTEEYLKQIAKNYDGFSYAILRYFNVAGADVKGRTGQVMDDATSIFKVISEVAAGKRLDFNVFGNDYDTVDGTAVRDYIHVCDLVDIHFQVAKVLHAKGGHICLNCGYGKGVSVNQVLKTYEKTSGVEIPYVIAPRRSGDVPSIVADVSYLERVLNWQPKYNSIEDMVRTAYEWESSNEILKS